MPRMNDLDQVEQDIRACLETILAEAKADAWLYEPTKWTEVIKTRLRDLAANKFNAKTCAAGCPKADEGEWLYDLAWYKMTDGNAGYLVRLDLVMELEWNPDPHMDGDFQKLVQARANHRLWIFEAATPDEIRGYIDRCQQQIETFEGTLQVDRYLLVGINRLGADRKFVFCPYVARREKRLKGQK